ncbi:MULTISPECIES: DUF4229 domain-containing protein [Brevibacterium]|jgi:mannitol-specific phosphotransferase system IIBC component|uniref:DUF4229 domain-containing protein n=1 Tax=Brevibacterium salitolerans TaxID=1403566 RepID=A0ABN2WVT9_9MICO|nr:DUF4229 domain-containing protein [Brevibacterium sp.]
MRSFLTYNLARLALLIGCVLVIWWIWEPSFVGTLAGIVISSLLSFVVLAPLRNESAQELMERMRKRREEKAAKPAKPRRDDAAEDRDIDGT